MFSSTHNFAPFCGQVPGFLCDFVPLLFNLFLISAFSFFDVNMSAFQYASIYLSLVPIRG